MGFIYHGDPPLNSQTSPALNPPDINATDVYTRQKRINQLRDNPNYKGFSDAELNEIANDNDTPRIIPSGYVSDIGVSNLPGDRYPAIPGGRVYNPEYDATGKNTMLASVKKPTAKDNVIAEIIAKRKPKTALPSTPVQAGM